jgi:hypothetical protein
MGDAMTDVRIQELPLSQGKVAIVDADDFERVSAFKWSFGGGGYAMKRSPPYRMHRFIMNAPADVEIDHINGNRLDNRRCNLRVCTRMENGRNLSLRRDNKSGFKGVRWHKGARKWCASIMVDQKSIHIGMFEDMNDAVLAYNKAARTLHGNFAKLNRNEATGELQAEEVAP